VRPAGFTLIEVVVSLAILSLVMLATVTGLRTLAATEGSLDTLVQRNDALRSVSSFLRDAMESAVVGSNSEGLVLGGSDSDKTVFEIQDGALVWKTVILLGENYGGSYIVRLGREQGSLVLRWNRDAALRRDFDWNSAPSRTLAKDLQSFAIAYRRRPKEEWREEWDGRVAPGWVRLRIESRQRFWPDIIAEVAH
jgi:general secretion pathway protein J